MPKKHTRKTQTPAQRMFTELHRAWKALSGPDDWPKGVVSFGHRDEPRVECEQRLWAWLRRLDEFPVAYSALLQIWVEAHTGECPADVFADDIRRRKGRGRSPNVELGQRAWWLYRPGKVGPTRIARRLLKDEFKRDPHAAAARIRAAIDTYKENRTAPDELEKLAYRMLGLEDDGKLPELEMPDDIRELPDEFGPLDNPLAE